MNGSRKWYAAMGAVLLLGLSACGGPGKAEEGTAVTSRPDITATVEDASAGSSLPAENTAETAAVPVREKAPADRPDAAGQPALDSADQEKAHAIEARIVTEVLDWGETITGIRIEYDDEIGCDAFRHDNWFQTYGTSSVRDITKVYVNNSGKPHDVEPYGKYVFLEYDTISDNAASYRDQVTFSEGGSVRPRLNTINVFQNHDLKTRSGKVVRAVMPGLPAGGAYLGASKELRVDIDSFVCEKYARNEERDVDLYTFLYIPEGYGENGCWMWNGFLKGEEARAQAEAQIKRGTEAGANSFITLFLPNTIGGNAHFSWTRVYSNPAVREWLLEQKNEVPYEPGA